MFYFTHSVAHSHNLFGRGWDAGIAPMELCLIFVEDQNSKFWIALERSNANRFSTKKILGIVGRMYPVSQPKDFRRWAQTRGKLIEIRIGAHDREAR